MVDTCAVSTCVMTTCMRARGCLLCGTIVDWWGQLGPDQRVPQVWGTSKASIETFIVKPTSATILTEQVPV